MKNENISNPKLIGCIIGIFLMLFLFGVAGLGTVFNNAIALNMTKR